MDKLIQFAVCLSVCFCSTGLDGLALLNMSREDFHDVGVTNPLHVRRLQIALRPYKLKFKDKQTVAGVMDTLGENSYYFSAEVKQTFIVLRLPNMYTICGLKTHPRPVGKRG